MRPGDFVVDLVVDRGLGEAWNPSSFSTYWSRYAKEQGFPSGVTFHGLRHGTAALLLDAGVPDAVTMAILGHGTMAMLRRYQGVSSALKRRAAERLDELLGG
jgi:integrase